MNTTTLSRPAAVDAAAAEAPSQEPGEAAASGQERGRPAPGVAEVGPELGVAAFLMLLGGLVVFDSLRLGAGWADDGPESGYFPFYIGSMLLASSGLVFIRAVAGWLAARGRPAASAPQFVSHEEFRLVLAMLVPATLYVAAMAWMGLYLASIVLIAWFMRRHGRFGWPLTAGVALGVPLVFFFVFERWFLVPLPKGPIERLLGF